MKRINAAFGNSRTFNGKAVGAKGIDYISRTVHILGWTLSVSTSPMIHPVYLTKTVRSTEECLFPASQFRDLCRQFHYLNNIKYRPQLPDAT